MILSKVKSVLTIVLIVLVQLVIGGISYYQPVFARTVTEVEKSLVDKTVFQGVYRCYDGGYTVNELPLSKYNGVSSLINAKYNDENYVPLVTGVTSSKAFKSARYKVKDGGLSCRQLFGGGDYVFGGSNSDLLTAFGKKAPDKRQTNQVVDFMRNMGYSVDQKGSSKCYSLSYTYSNKEGRSSELCLKNGNIEKGEKGTTLGGGARAELSYRGGKQICLTTYQAKLPNQADIKKDYCEEIESPGEFSGKWLLSKIVSKNCSGNKCDGFTFSTSLDSGVSEQNSLSDYTAKINNSLDGAALAAIRFLSGNDGYTNYQSLMFTPIEVRLLYQDYLESYYGVSLDCNKDTVAEGRKIAWLDKSASPPAMKQCTVTEAAKKSAKNANNPVNGVNNTGFIEYQSIKNVDELIDLIAKLPESYSDTEIASIDSTMESDTEQSASDASTVCYQASGALGWIICPAVAGLSDIGSTMWDYVEKNFMQIQASELFDESRGVAEAWAIVRDIANIVFIILFLCVIFSQVTGIGIDNYGIKKIMPKLIITAVLVNLSYIICELAVDLSNIIGSGIQTMLSNFAADVGTGASATTDGAGNNLVMIPTMLAGGGIALFGLLGTGVLNVVAAGVAVLSTIFSVVAAIIALFIILVVREAGVVLLVVIAPLAMACYLLPNTEKLYKKWFDFFKVLLIIYPICGAMVGAGKFAGAILATIDSPAMKVAALIVQVLPFFLIPTLLRSSMSVMGNIGAKISGAVNGAGKNLSGQASKALEGSDSLNHFNNRLGMMSLSKKKRASAFEAEMGRRSAAYRRGRNADRGIMRERLEAAQAEDEAKAQSEDTARRVAYMRRNGIDLKDNNGKKTGTTTFNANGVEKRLKQLARKNSLNADETEEIAALMNAASDMPGGTGAMSRIIRDNNTTKTFMRAAGAAYARDSSVRSKLSGDAGASYYTEQFGPGGKDQNSGPNDNRWQSIQNFATFKSDDPASYDNQIKNRSPNYQTGLSQSGGLGGALGEYLQSLSPDDLRNIRMDDKLLNSIDSQNRADFERFYRDYFGANNNQNGN